MTFGGRHPPLPAAPGRIVSRNARIIATNAAEIAVTSRSRKAWRKRVAPDAAEAYLVLGVANYVSGS